MDEPGPGEDARASTLDTWDALVAERDAALAELERARRRGVALSALAHELAAAEGTTEVVGHLAASLTGLLDCDSGAVWLWDGAVGEIRAVATIGLPPDLHEALLAIPVRADQTPELADLLARREPLVLPRGAVTPVLEGILEGLGLQLAIGVTLLSGERLLGAVTASWLDVAPEGEALQEAIQRLQGIADQGATALRKAELLDRAHYLSLHDGLTGLPNRLLFQRRLDEALVTKDKEGQVAVLFCDLDRFKQVNDELGHAAGDEVLRLVAARLRAAVPVGGLLGRLSGDEFAVLLPACAGAQEADLVGRSLVTVLDEPLRVEGQSLRVTASVGVALDAGPLGTSEDLLRSADAAMYDAKRRGRNQVVPASRAGRVGTGPARSLAVELHDALPAGELRLFLQPVFALDSEGGHEMCGAEALVRWQHPRLGLLAPATFLSLAEDDRSVVALDHWMVREACREAADWPQSPGPERHIAVNLSVHTLLDDRLHETVRTALVEQGLPAGRLQLEVVEGRALRDLPVVAERLRALRHLGVRVALDDFGTGFSTLAWLQELPVDMIKVDRSLTKDTAETGDLRRLRVANALLRGMVAVGGDLGVDVLAEGVETEAQVVAVRAAGCRLVQGFLLGRPGPPEDLLPLLA